MTHEWFRPVGSLDSHAFRPENPREAICGRVRFTAQLRGPIARPRARCPLCVVALLAPPLSELELRYAWGDR